jgi:hypothetical protein
MLLLAVEAALLAHDALEEAHQARAAAAGNDHFMEPGGRFEDMWRIVTRAGFGCLGA